MTKDSYAHLAKHHNSSVDHAIVVTPDDDNDLPFVSNGITVIGEGAVKVTTRGGDTLVLPELPAGTIGWYWPIFITRVWAEGTTATAIVAFSI